MSEAEHKLTIEIMKRFVETLKKFQQDGLTLEQAIESLDIAIELGDKQKMFV